MVSGTPTARALDAGSSTDRRRGIAVAPERPVAPTPTEPELGSDDGWRPLLAGALSHELRATLALISGYSQSLLHLPLDDATRRRYLERIQAATETLTEFADQILEMAGPGDVRPVLRRRPVALEWLVGRLVRQLAADAEAGKVRYQRAPDLPLVDIDPLWIGQVLRNLVRNALTHGATPDGVVTILAHRADDAVVVTVRDDGPGFDDDEREVVFQPFYRGRRARASDRAGVGFGLYLCRELVEAHGGRIWVEETPSGAAVSFSLPTCRPAAVSPAGTTPETSAATL